MVHNQVSFLVAIDVTREKSRIRKVIAIQSNEKAKAANPGPLNTEGQYHKRVPKIINYLSTIMRVYGIPLPYITSINEIPDCNGSFVDFVHQTILQAPLSNTVVPTDNSTVHQLVLFFTTGESSETWVKPVLKFKDGVAKAYRRCLIISWGKETLVKRITRTEKL